MPRTLPAGRQANKYQGSSIKKNSSIKLQYLLRGCFMKMGSLFFCTSSYGLTSGHKKDRLRAAFALVCILVATLQFDKLQFHRHTLIIFCCKEINTRFKICHINSLYFSANCHIINTLSNQIGNKNSFPEPTHIV